jgi:exonuclease III
VHLTTKIIHEHVCFGKKTHLNQKSKQKMKLCIVTANACLSVCPPLRYNGAFARSERFSGALYAKISPDELDVICLQELIINRQKVLDGFSFHPFTTGVVQPTWFGNNIRFVESGLTIASKWPILNQSFHTFTGKSYHAETLMAKSVLYAHIHLQKQYSIHVFVTHMQAWSNAKSKKIRFEQCKQIYHFIESQHIPADEPVILCGDFNVDFYEHFQTIREMMQVVTCTLCLPETPQFSFDPTMNQLVGTDDAAEYATRSHQHGCYNEFLESGVCPCCPKQLIDGFALSNNHKQPSSFHVEVIHNVAPNAFDVYINVSTTRQIQNVSDHFAVMGQFVFDSLFDTQPTFNHHQEQPNLEYWIWIFCQIVIVFYLWRLIFRWFAT